MKKKIIIIAVVIVVAAAAVGLFAWKKPANIPVVMQTDPVTGQSVYTNTDYGFSVTYSKDWEGPAERIAADPDKKDSAINAIFISASSSEAIVIQGKPGDTESFNEFAASLDAYTMVTAAGVPALRYEYVAPINEELSAYAKTVIFTIKGLKAGSVSIAYQKIAPTEAKAKAADLTKFNEFVSHIVFK